MFILSQSPPLFGPEVAHVSALFSHEEYTDAVAFRFDVNLPCAMQRAVAKRKAEYVAGRACATYAARVLLGDFQGQIESSAQGLPVWPEGVVGSITHTMGFASAALARVGVVRSLGLDTERIMTEEVMHKIGPTVCSAEERMSPGSGLSDNVYTTIVFSAKESVFKCIYPLTRRMFWFDNAHIEILDITAGSFRATLETDLSEEFRNGTTFEGRFRIAPPFVHTGLLLAPNQI